MPSDIIMLVLSIIGVSISQSQIVILGGIGLGLIGVILFIGGLVGLWYYEFKGQPCSPTQ